MRKILATGLVLTGLASLSSNPALACGEEAYTGSICAYAGSYCPAGTIMADGTSYKMTNSAGQQDPLYKVIGDTYGTNPANGTYAVPDLRGVYLAAPGGNILIGKQAQAIGSETTTLQANQLPPHDHSAQVAFTPSPILQPMPIDAKLQATTDTAVATSDTPTGTSNYLGPVSSIDNMASLWNSSISNPFTLVATNNVASSSDLAEEISKSTGLKTEDTGGSENSISIIPPQLGITYCIINNGVTPSFE